MAAYLIIDIEKIQNRYDYEAYLEEVESIVSIYGGEYIAKSDNIVPFSGNWKPEKIVILKFQTLAELKTCFDSHEYLSIKKYREESTTARAVVLIE